MSLHERLWADVLQPGYERLRGRQTPRLEKELAASQWGPPEALVAHQWRELELLLDFASREVPFYRDWFAGSGISVKDLVAARDLSPLPIIERAQFNAERQRFQPASPPPGSFDKSTGGTSGSPLRFKVSPFSDQWRWAVTRRGYAWAGCRPGTRQVHLWSGDLAPLPLVPRLKRGLHRMLQGQRYIDSFHLGPAELDQALATISAYRPACMVVFTSAAEMLARHALQRGWRPPAGLRSILTGAESLHPHQRELFTRAFGCEVFETYGSREFMLMACECPAHQGLHLSAENLMLEVVKDGRPAAPGQVGEILVTDLHNFAQPFIRYQNGDLAVMAEGDCPCGRGLPRLARLEGRILEVLRAPGGQELTGTFFPHMIKDFPAVVRFQVEQDRLDHLIIRVVLDGELPQDQRQTIMGLVRRSLPGVEPEIREVTEIPLTAAGKRRVTIGLGATGQGPAS